MSKVSELEEEVASLRQAYEDVLALLERRRCEYHTAMRDWDAERQGYEWEIERLRRRVEELERLR